MEVLLSSIKPEHLMFGKLVGLGAASLLQIAVWTATAMASVLALNLIVDLPIELTSDVVPAPGRLLIALAYFLLGYALIGTLLAAIGAVTTNQRQAGNISAFVILPAVAPMWFMFLLLEEPDGALAEAPQLHSYHRAGGGASRGSAWAAWMALKCFSASPSSRSALRVWFGLLPDSSEPTCSSIASSPA